MTSRKGGSPGHTGLAERATTDHGGAVAASGAGPASSGASAARTSRNGKAAYAPVQSRRILVMLGAPGAGKGTQAAILAEQLGLPQISSGDLFRAHVRDETPLGEEVKRYLDKGALVPDDLTVRMVRDRLAEPDAVPGAILDGFPRTVPQAQALDRILAQQGTRVKGALYVEVDRDELVRRLSGRRVCTGPAQHVYHLEWNPPRVSGVCDIDGTPLEQRADDRPETVRARLEKQLPPMYEVVDHYTQRGVLCPVRGDRPIADVTESLLHAVETACQVP